MLTGRSRVGGDRNLRRNAVASITLRGTTSH